MSNDCICLEKQGDGSFNIKYDTGEAPLFKKIGSLNTQNGEETDLVFDVNTGVVYYYIRDNKTYIPMRNVQGQLFRYIESMERLSPYSKYAPFTDVN